MGLASWLTGGLIKSGAKAVKDVSEVFRPNAEASEQREFEGDNARLAQYAAEFRALEKRTWADALADALNRLVRPIVALGILAPIPSAIAYPEYTAIAFASLALLPAGYWALVGVILPFYFGGRMQIKSHDFHKSIAVAAANAPQVIEGIRKLKSELTPGVAADDDPEFALELADPDAFKNPVLQ